jgi:hypothetical protein
MKSPSKTTADLFNRFRRLILFVLTIPAVLAVSLAAFAIWTSNSTSQQQITAGSGPQIVLSSSSPNTVSGSGLTLTFAPYTDAQPTFTTGDQTVMVSNTGITSATIASIVLAGTPGTGANSTALNSELYVCVADSQTEFVLYNGPLSAFTSMTGPNWSPGDVLSAGSARGLIVNVYAGDAMTFCGTVPAGSQSPNGADALSSAPALTNPAQGGTDNVSISTTWQ